MEEAKRDLEEKVRQFKKETFGARFTNATLADVRISVANESLLHTFLTEPSATLHIMGPSGVGKTYLMAAIFEHLTLKYKNRARQLIYTENQLIGHLKDFEKGNYHEEANFIGSVPILYIDDLGTVNMTDWRKEALYCIIDQRYRNMRPTIITTPLKKNELVDNYGERIARRLLDEKNTIINYY